MKRSEVIQELLKSYYFQWGYRADRRVTEKTRKLIKQYQKEEEDNK